MKIIFPDETLNKHYTILKIVTDWNVGNVHIKNSSFKYFVFHYIYIYIYIYIYSTAHSYISECICTYVFYSLFPTLSHLRCACHFQWQRNTGRQVKRGKIVHENKQPDWTVLGFLFYFLLKCLKYLIPMSHWPTYVMDARIVVLKSTSNNWFCRSFNPNPSKRKYTHNYIYIYIYTHKHSHTHTQTRAHTHTHTHTYTYIYIYICVCVCVCL